MILSGSNLPVKVLRSYSFSPLPRKQQNVTVMTSMFVCLVNSSQNVDFMMNMKSHVRTGTKRQQETLPVSAFIRAIKGPVYSNRSACHVLEQELNIVSAHNSQ